MSLRGIVALSGKMCSGKSTQAEELVKRWDGLAVRLGFASQLKRDVRVLMGLSAESLQEPSIKYVVRPVLQHYGNGMRELYGNEYWCRRLLRTAAIKRHEYLIVDDVRYPNELRYLQMYAWLIGAKFASVRLYFSDHDQDGVSATQDQRYLETYGHPLTAEIRGHASETALDQYYSWDVLLNALFPADQLALALRDSLRLQGFEELSD